MNIFSKKLTEVILTMLEEMLCFNYMALANLLFFCFLDNFFLLGFFQGISNAFSEERLIFFYFV